MFFISILKDQTPDMLVENKTYRLKICLQYAYTTEENMFAICLYDRGNGYQIQGFLFFKVSGIRKIICKISYE